MIFVTVGSLYPFDRLVRAADKAARDLAPLEFFAQVGDTAYQPEHMPFARLLNRDEFKQVMQKSKVIVAHAGMGSVISSMESAIPIILVPRRLELGEHNTDHQMATARWLQDRPGVYVCPEEGMLSTTIAAALNGNGASVQMSQTAPEPFLSRIRQYIQSV